MKKNRDCKGSMTIEAVFALPIFIFAFTAFLIVTKYIYLQVVLQNAINQTAKEIAQYSYIVSKVSALDVLTEGEDAESKAYLDTTNEYVSGIMDFFEVMQDEGAEIRENLDISTMLSDIDTTTKNLQNSYSSISGAANQLIGATEDYFEDPKGMFAGLVSVVKNGAIDVVKSRFIAAPVSRALCKKYLPCEKKGADSYLKAAGIKDGIKGLNFNLSTLFEDGKSINIVVVYTISQEIPLFGTMEIDCKLTASTAGWLKKGKARN